MQNTRPPRLSEHLCESDGGGQAGSVDAISRAIRFLSPGFKRSAWLMLHFADSLIIILRF